MEITKAFSVVLLRLRKEKGLTHEKLAELASLHPTSISLLERNLRQPSISTLFQLAKALGMEPSELIKDVEKLRGKTVSKES